MSVEPLLVRSEYNKMLKQNMDFNITQSQKPQTLIITCDSDSIINT